MRLLPTRKAVLPEVARSCPKKGTSGQYGSPGEKSVVFGTLSTRNVPAPFADTAPAPITSAVASAMSFSVLFAVQYSCIDGDCPHATVETNASAAIHLVAMTPSGFCMVFQDARWAGG